MKKNQYFIAAIGICSFFLFLLLFIHFHLFIATQQHENENDEEVLARIKQEILMTKDPHLGFVPTDRLEAARQKLMQNSRIASYSVNSPGNSLLRL